MLLFFDFDQCTLRLRTPKRENEEKRSGMNRDLQEIEDWIALARAAEYELKVMAGRCHCSLRELERHFDECRCFPPEEWTFQVRLFDSFRLMVEGQSVKEAAQNTGFKSLGHFYHRFKSFFDAPPLQCLKIYRQRERQKCQAEKAFADVMPKDWAQFNQPFYAQALAILNRLPQRKRNHPQIVAQRQ